MILASPRTPILAPHMLIPHILELPSLPREIVNKLQIFTTLFIISMSYDIKINLNIASNAYSSDNYTIF